MIEEDDVVVIMEGPFSGRLGTVIFCCPSGAYEVEVVSEEGRTEDIRTYCSNQVRAYDGGF